MLWYMILHLSFLLLFAQRNLEMESGLIYNEDLKVAEEKLCYVMEEEESPSELYRAAESGDAEGVRRLIAAGAKMSADSDYVIGETPLHAAVKAGHHAVVQLLLDAGHTVNVYSESYQTPLHLAVDNDDVPTVELLLRRGADLDAKDSGDATPLMYAAFQGFCRTAAVLLRHGAAVNARRDGEVSLNFAIRRGHHEMMVLLLEAGADTKSLDSSWLLHMVAPSRHVDIAKELLKCGADINAVDDTGDSPLLVACENGNSVMTEFLLEEGADVNAVGGEGATALELAVLGADARCVEVLEKHCAKLRAANFHVSSPLLGLNASADFRGRCDAEVEKMKGTGVNGVSASVYDVLVSDVDRAALLLRNDDLRSLVSQDLTGIFPIYSSMIERAVKKATNRLLLMDDATEALEALTRSRLPTEILGEVTKYLSDRDLSAVVAAYRERIVLGLPS